MDSRAKWIDAERGRVITTLRSAGCVFAEDEAAILLDSAESASDLELKVRRRREGVPLEHVVGWAEFRGMRVRVADGVFIPRRRSSALVDLACARLRLGDRLLEICCGSGALALACSVEVPHLVIAASDIDPAAVACAAANLDRIGTVIRGDLFAGFPEEFRANTAVVLANVPYVPSAALDLVPRDILAGEPLHTRHGGEDGLDVFRRVLQNVPEWLALTGCLISELHESQTSWALRAARDAGLTSQITHGEHGQAVIVVER